MKIGFDIGGGRGGYDDTFFHPRVGYLERRVICLF